jgi:two-component system, chemotaxis family, sensor kinase CheA
VERDPYRYFRVEARELLDGLGGGVLKLEKGGTPEVVAGLLRLAHTLKGAARVVKQPAIAEHAHAIEESLSELLGTRTPPAHKQTDQVLTLLDAIAAKVAAIDAPAPDSSEARRSGSVDKPTEVVRGDTAAMDALGDGVAEAGLQLRNMRGALGAVARARQLAERLAEQVPLGNESSSLRLRSWADELRDLVSSFDRQLVGAVDHAEREVHEMRDAVERLRLVPASTLFVWLERTARDVAQSLGRETSFEASGGEVRLDAQVLAALQGALVQLVRNAVAHGIEAVAERTSAGKPAAGRVSIAVARRGNRVTFVCRDDGRGVDLEAVRRVAERRGVLPAGGPQLDAAALLKVLLKGGLTTSGAVTQLSGRGIGLDVVRETAAQLGGDVTVQTEAGKGTVFELSVPLSLSSLDALVVEVDGISAAIPLHAVRRTVRLASGDVSRTAEGETVVNEGQVIPFVYLARALRRQSAPAWNDTARSAVVVQGATALAAVGVDRLRGTASIVLRPLSELAPADPVILGAAIDQEGSPQLVLDPVELVAAAFHRETAAGPTAEARAPASVLVIDDSLTTRMLERSILESAGYQVELATSAEEGLEMARRGRYQLFLVDLELPGMDGFTFIATTRADAALRAVPAILVTSRSAPEDRRRSTEVGASGYVVKGDFDQGQLLALIRTLVR